MRFNQMIWLPCCCNILFLLGCNAQEQNLLGNDYRLFKPTPAWELAQAVENENIDEIRKIAQQQKELVNYQEEKFGSTLLKLAVLNDQIVACKTLLELGADPNRHDHYSGITPLIIASDMESDNPSSLEFMELLLRYGADPNIEETGERKDGNTTRLTPLLAACQDVNQARSPIEKVKKLIEAGADVDYKNEFGASALKSAVTFDHYDVVLYLLQHGANYELPLGRSDGKDSYLSNKLRLSLFQLDSKQYKDKMLVVEFLKERGIDYRKTPIPDYAISKAKKMFPKTWREYLRVY